MDGSIQVLMEHASAPKIQSDYFASTDIFPAVQHGRIPVSKTDAEAQAITAQALNGWRSLVTQADSNGAPAVVICDRGELDLPVVYASSVLESLTGYHPSEMLGRNCRFLQRPDYLTPGRVVGPLPAFNGFDPTRAVLRQKIRNGEAAYVRIINYHKTGRAFLNGLTVVPVEFQGSPYYVGFVTDITPKHNTHEFQLFTSANIRYPDNIDEQHHIMSPANDSMRLTTSMLSDDSECTSPNVSASSIQSDELLSMLAAVQGQIVCVISLSGCIMFLSGDVKHLLGYSPQALCQHCLFDFLHPQDISAFRAELRKVVPGSGREIICRALTADGNVAYIDFRASRGLSSKATSPYVILSGNLLPAIAIPERKLVAEISSRHPPLWAKISMSGLFLYGTSALRSLFHEATLSELHSEQPNVVGLTLQSRLCQHSCSSLDRALATMSNGLVPSVDLRHCFMRPDGSKLIMVSELLLPQGLSQPTAPTRPSFVLVRMQYTVNDSKPAQPLRKRSSKRPMRIASYAKCDPNCIAAFEQPSTWSSTSSTSANHQQPRGQTRRSSVTQSSLRVQTTFEDSSPVESVMFGFDPPSIPESTLKHVPMQPDDPMAPWQYSIHRLALENEQLREKLQDHITRASARHRRMRARQRGQICANCGTSDTPEWRKGPMGMRDLCNRCGLRYAKEKSKQQQDQDVAEPMDKKNAVESKERPDGGDGQNDNDSEHDDQNNDDDDEGGDGASGSDAMDTN